jgi:carbon storage regulator
VLVLTRRANQSIVIGSEVIVTVLEVRGDQVRLGITAPRRIDVHREEVFLALQEANAKAAAAAALVDDEELEESEDLDRAAADR